MNDVGMIVSRVVARHAALLLEERATVLAERMLALAPELGLDGPNDVTEVLDMWFSLEERASSSLYVQGLTRSVLSITSWSLAARIAFLHRHLKGREFVPLDDAIGGVLFGSGEEAVP